jgi:hypothetical protein
MLGYFMFGSEENELAFNSVKHQQGTLKGGSITVLLTSCLTGLDESVCK